MTPEKTLTHLSVKEIKWPRLLTCSLRALPCRSLKRVAPTSCTLSNASHLNPHSAKVDEIDKEATLTDEEIIRLFDSRNVDLKLGFFDQMFFRFKEHCQRKCINRKLKLENVGTHAITYHSSLWASTALRKFHRCYQLTTGSRNST